jgi:hypothetical protein
MSLLATAYRGTRLPPPRRIAGGANLSTSHLIEPKRKAALLQKIKDDGLDATGQRTPQDAPSQDQEEPERSSMSDFADGSSRLCECLSSLKQGFSLQHWMLPPLAPNLAPMI